MYCNPNPIKARLDSTPATTRHLEVAFDRVYIDGHPHSSVKVYVETRTKRGRTSELAIMFEPTAAREFARGLIGAADAMEGIK